MKCESGVHEKGAFRLEKAIEGIKKQRGFSKAGVIATFIGVVRGENSKGEKVEKLTLEAYEEKADQVLRGICSDLRKSPDVVDVQIHHLLGEFSVGDELVYVLVAGSHRKGVLRVLERAVERYKKEAPIFKKEHILTKKGEKKACWIE